MDFEEEQATSSSFSDMSDCKLGVFWLEPYLQLGEDHTGQSLEVVWFSPLGSKHWRAEWRQSHRSDWHELTVNRLAELKLPGISVDVKQHAAILPIHESEPGEEPQYRLLVHGHQVLMSTIVRDYNRVVVFGDYAGDSPGPALTAKSVSRIKPGLIVVVGDIAYEHGRMVEYRRYYFPAINSDEVGAALLRSCPSVATPGNHCVKLVKKSAEYDPNDFDDLFGFFRVFRHPKTGPDIEYSVIAESLGEDERTAKQRKRARRLQKTFGEDFLRHSNYSFDWGNQHWVSLDGNPYMDWSEPHLRQWLRSDLKAAKSDWKCVIFHNPAFNNDMKYWCEQHMRLIFDILDEEGVDFVFCGHCHYFERHKPLRFVPSVSRPAEDGTVAGELTIDEDFDGINKTRPNGVICIITGAGGRTVSDEAKRSAGDHTATTARLIDDQRSFTVLDFDGRLATVRQLNDDLAELDKIVVDKR